jgi:hypothetical protein
MTSFQLRLEKRTKSADTSLEMLAAVADESKELRKRRAP